MEYASAVMLAILLGMGAVVADAGFHPGESAASCASGELFKTDYLGLGCYTDNGNPKYYEAVHQQMEDARKMRLYMYSGIAIVAVLTVGLLWFFSGSKTAVSAKKR